MNEYEVRRYSPDEGDNADTLHAEESYPTFDKAKAAADQIAVEGWKAVVMQGGRELFEEE